MTPVLKFYFKNFALIFVVSGISTLFSNYFFEGEWIIVRNAISTLGFSIIFSTFFVYKHTKEVKKLHPGQKFTDKDFLVKQAILLQLPLTKEQILSKLQNDLPGREWQIIAEGEMIRMKVPYTWRSYGEKIVVKVKQLNNELSEVFLESRPTNPLTIVDYGKNQENVIYLRNLLAA